MQVKLLVGSDIITDIQSGHEVAHIVNHVTVLVDINRVQVELDTTISRTLLSGEKIELVVQLDADAGVVDGSREIVNHAVCVVRTVEALTVTVREPVVDISFRFDAELVHIEVALLKSVPEMSVETALHIQIKIELVRLLFDVCQFFK